MLGDLIIRGIHALRTETHNLWMWQLNSSVPTDAPDSE